MITTIVIVGVVTGGLGIRFDRFFAIILMLFVLNFSIVKSIDVYLWIIMLGALTVIIANRNKIAQIPTPMKKKLFILIPILTLVSSYAGSILFINISHTVLINTLGVLAILYGLRLILIHFKPQEMDYQNLKPKMVKFCGLFGPILSGFSIGFVGTSLKALKIPFAIKVGKINAKQVYIGNTMGALFASLFTIVWHYTLGKNAPSLATLTDNASYGISLWLGIWIVYLITERLFKESWKKPFQIFIGVMLLLASVKIFMLT